MKPYSLLKHITVSLCVTALVVSLLSTTVGSVQAQQRALSLIRDAEIEHTIRAYGTPLFTTAGLDPNAVKIYLVNEKSLNAFVAGGQNMFINTGLLMRSEHAGQVIGVMAHETGHITGGHLTRFDEAMRNAQITSIISYILAAGAAVMSRDGRAAGAVMAAGQDTAMRTFLKYTRTQEQAADQFAVNLLDNVGISSKGMLEFFRILEGQEFLVASRQDPYIRTHPLTSARIDFVRNHVANSPYSNTPIPKNFEVMHKRMKAKLVGFLEPSQRVFRTYKKTDNSVYSRYARAVANHRDARTDQALKLVDSLIAEAPEDPYFLELKGQILFESGRIRESLPPYEKSVRYLPAEPLLRSALAAAQLETHDPKLVRPALSNLKEASRKEPDTPRTWRLLATAYGRIGQKNMAVISLAEEAVRLNRNGDAVRLGNQALEMFEEGSPQWLRAQDIIRVAEQAQGHE